MTTENGLISAILLDGQGGGIRLGWPGIREWTPDLGVLWVHLDYTDDNAQTWLLHDSGLDPLVSEALIAEETRPRCSHIAEGLLVCLRGVNSNPGADHEDMVSLRLFSTNKVVVSTRRRRLLSIQDMVEALEHGDGPRTTGDLISTLTNRLIERMSDVINELEDRIDALEEMVIDGGAQEMRTNILELRREIIKLRRYLAPQREALNQLYIAKVAWMNEHDRLEIREAYDKISRYVEDLDSAKDRASVTYEALSGQLAEQLNNRMYVLSVIAGLFLPLGFLTGLLGINVGGIPLAESPWGFFYIIVFLAVLVIAEIIIFRRKKWF